MRITESDHGSGGYSIEIAATSTDEAREVLELRAILEAMSLSGVLSVLRAVQGIVVAVRVLITERPIK